MIVNAPVTPLRGARHTPQPVAPVRRIRCPAGDRAVDEPFGTAALFGTADTVQVVAPRSVHHRRPETHQHERAFPSPTTRPIVE
ncbi:hypothetical protein BKN37_08950 [Mycobacterium talmoniae]|uniref:Uncharacterized protein n=1 Tax=Mycobacterium talmoniae TaxID=1858794 RepID=A0A1S1NFZ9_9MYCO|nr:hypothetical protein BKN37_08950 [Mycobacterium talmoniae]